ncbi:hypothetical protein PR202_ga19789 [Eleusine coracana subsp. coracana]|uniref:Uncharacterized protein n=1 Tax=Eleusine coracana subsp. coracana TaxID=191504 RepID=A0AAV5CVP5_ELECO|nr:hypothetical protein PR202_ga19789 [Eleusine coracana subsp. coracana]
MREMTAPRTWFLLLLPLILLLARHASARLFRNAKRAMEQQQDDDENLHHRLPPSPPALPVLGHLHHLVGSLPHVSLRRLSTKHGLDLMMLRLGAMPVLVVSSPRAAEAVLRTHDHVFASRPHSLAVEIILYGPSDIGFAPHGEYWRRARKLITTHLLNPMKVQAFRLAREDEVGMVMSRIREAAAAGAAVDVGELLRSFTNDLACRAVMGKSFRTGGRNRLCRELVAETSPLLAGFNVEELFPFLARFGVLSKAVRAKSERVKRRWDELLDGLIQDHEHKYDDEQRDDTSASGDTRDDDFVHVLLSVRDEYGLTRDQMKALLLDVFFGGTESSAAVLDYTMAELMRRPRIMKKLQAAVRTRVPEGQRFVTEADLTDNTPCYLRAVIKESLRLHAVTPLLAPHMSMASCSIDGYTIPAGTQAVINIRAIGRDARFWEDPEEFVPERFVDGGSAAHLNVSGNDFQFLPFGSGRRMCAGINFGMASMQLMLANLVHCFDWEMPEGKDRRDIDMSEMFGLVVRRKEKLLLLPKLPRL